MNRLQRCHIVALSVALLPLAANLIFSAPIELPPHGNRSIHDLAGVIHANDAEAMARELEYLFNQSQISLVIVTVRSLDGESIEAFADRVGNEWGVGGPEGGIVIALSVEDRQVRISTDDRAENVLTDLKAGQILDEAVIPYLRTSDYSTGLIEASRAISTSITGRSLTGPSTPLAGTQRRRPVRASNDDEGALKACAALTGCAGFMLLIPLAILVLNILLLAWVARDARARAVDNAILWMLLVMFTSLIGLAIYLLARPRGALVICAKCSNRRLQSRTTCPHCGNS